MSSKSRLTTEHDMGEIRVKVLLTNSVDEALHRRKKLKKSAVRRYEADAVFYEARARQCRSEAALLQEELENERTGKQPALEVARKIAEAILRLQGLTGAEIDAAERTLSDEPVDLERLRQIAANHSILNAELL